MSTGRDTCGYDEAVAPMVNTDELIDARVLAELLGLSHPNSVSLYQRRYPDMPRPVIDLGRGRPRLWCRPDVESWLAGR
jgi:glutathione-regulated potassium-efflux system ancillary protein KefG